MSDSRSFEELDEGVTFDDVLMNPAGAKDVAELLQDNDVAGIIEDIAALLASKSWTGWYKHPRTKKTWAICKDRDGYLVYKPGGGRDAWGTGYTWREVKSGYGLAGVGWFKERRSNSDCR